MCLRATKNMYREKFLVFFIFINYVFTTSAQVATKTPFVIFQPGEFFDPFTEPSEDHRPSASATQQPNVFYGDTSTAFIQPFWNLPVHNAPSSYPRTVAGTSGNAAQVNAQIRQPSTYPSTYFKKKLEKSDTPLSTRNRKTSNVDRSKFTKEKGNVDAQIRHPSNSAQTSTYFNKQADNPEAQLKTGIKSTDSFGRTPKVYPRTIAQSSGNAARINAQIRQPYEATAEPSASLSSKAEASENHIRTVNDSLETLRRLTAQGKKEARDYQSKKSKLNDFKNVRPSSLIAEASVQPISLIDQSIHSELVAHPSHHAASKSHGGGKSRDSGHHDSHSDKGVKDYKSHHQHDTKDFEKHDDHNKKSQHSEKGGHAKEHHDEAGHYKKYHEGKKSHKAAKFGEKKGHKRGHNTRGYHNKFHRDEYHREHRFYDDYNKEGYHEKHGNARSHHKKKQGGYKKGGSHKSGHSAKKHGKKGHSDKGNVIDEQKGFDREGGRKKYHKHHKDYHEKRGSSKGSKYGHTKHN